jgi:hypothetical protein
LLGPEQLSSGTSIEICVLGSDTAESVTLRQANIQVYALGWTRWLDLSALLRLRQILRRSEPDVIHVWQWPVLRTLAVVARQWLHRVVMSARVPDLDALPWWDRILLGQIRCLDVPFGGRLGEASRVEKSADTQSPFTIVCLGALERESGFRDAIWAFDILLQHYPNAQLQLVGTGSQHASLTALVGGLESERSVQFVGDCIDVTAMLRQADVVWAPSVADCGRQVALDAMALGQVVVATDVPGLRSVIRHGETGYIVPVGDVVALARRTHALFQDEALRGRIGEAAGKVVEEQFSLNNAVASWAEAYRSLAA